jgi:exosortase
MPPGDWIRKLPTEYAPALLILALAGTFVALLSQDWEVYPQYGYGWLVPPISAYLFYRRWPDRPTPAPFATPSTLVSVALIGFFLIWPALWIFREANPDWRLVSWASGAGALLGMLAVIGHRGGMPWLKHFAFPVLLMLLAIPWPSGLEQSLIQAMTRAVTATTVEGLTWCGIYAEQTGNVILLSRGSVGVDEACSGVRSFQSNLMAALVVGELFRLSPLRRFFLLAAGLAVGFGLNLFRSMFLAWNANRSGAAGVDQWHDPAGYTILLVSFALLLFLAWKWISPASVQQTSPSPSPLPAPHIPLSPTAGWVFSAAILWLLLCPLITEVWFRVHEGPSQQNLQWRLEWADNPQPKVLPIPEKVRTILRFGEARALVWKEDPGRDWFLYEMDWPPGRAGAQLARSHSPEICLPASGAVLQSQGDPRIIQPHGLRMVLTPYTFLIRERPVHVFFALWEQQNAPEGTNPEMNYYAHRQRLLAVLEGRRNRGQKVLHATLAGYPSRDDAEKAFLAFLESHIVVQPHGLPTRP